MKPQSIQETLKQGLVKELRLEGVDPQSLDPHAPLFGEEGLGLDSLDAVELVVMVEKLFGVVIADAEEASRVFTSIATLTDFITEQQAANKA